ncbi:MAG: hypothetical protein LBO78_00465 [Rickettsiales bacterium]|jgi:hypothetical protein|nr:hypothetical protein [Rickettsiales bacterium]
MAAKKKSSPLLSIFGLDSLFVKIVIILLVLFAAYFASTMVRRMSERRKLAEERLKIDREIEEIKDEIFVRQCNLERMYCCHYNRKEACAKWKEAGCRETGGGSDIDCAIKSGNG